MDKRVGRSLKEFTRRLHEKYPDAIVEVEDYKWSTEDVSVTIQIPQGMTEEEEDHFLDIRTELTGDLLHETGVYILALARTPDKAEV